MLNDESVYVQFHRFSRNTPADSSWALLAVVGSTSLQFSCLLAAVEDGESHSQKGGTVAFIIDAAR